MSDNRHVPDSAEIRAILEKYFEGPISAAQVAIIDAKLRDVVSDATKLRVEIRAFDANASRYHGRLWREELGAGPRAPDPKDLVPWFASTLDGFPPARPYCPAALVGSWTGGGSTWRLDASGSLMTTQPPFAEFDRWYVRRRGDKVGDLLMLAKTFPGQEQLVIDRVTADALDLRHLHKELLLHRSR